jgi:hypothetical protein
VSLGIPRVINNVCDNALLRGFARGLRVINEAAIEDVVDLLDLNVVQTEFAGSSPLDSDSSRRFQFAHD